MNKGIILPIIIASVFASGCQTTQQHKEQVRADEGERVTVGTVQREVRIGMPAHDILKALGSPNIVTKSGLNGETWVYDKFSTETAYSTSSGGVGALILAGSSNVGGGVGGNYSATAGATSTSQRTLTIILQLENGVLKDFDYHSTRF